MDRYEKKRKFALWLPSSLEKEIRGGRRKVNLSNEIRKLIELGLEVQNGTSSS